VTEPGCRFGGDAGEKLRARDIDRLLEIYRARESPKYVEVAMDFSRGANAKTYVITYNLPTQLLLQRIE
jgi:hypothetical protein